MARIQKRIELKEKCKIVHKIKNTFSEEIKIIYEGWNFNSGNYLFTTDTK